MSETYVPSARACALIALVSAPYLWLAVNRAERLVPERPAPEHRWMAREIVMVVGVLLLATGLVGSFVAPGATLPALMWSQAILGAGGLAALALALRRPGGLAGLGLGVRPELRGLLAIPLVYLPGIFLFFALQATWLRIVQAFGWEEQQEAMVRILALDGGELALAGLVAVLVGPLVEELLFRGFLQSALEQRIGARAGLLVTAAVFTALHGTAGVPGLFLLSLFLGWLRQRTRGLFLPWCAHAFSNGVMLALALVIRAGYKGAP